MQIVQIEGLLARCQAKGLERDVSLLMLQDNIPQVGEHVLVHLGHAVHALTESQASSTWELLDEMLEEA